MPSFTSHVNPSFLVLRASLGSRGASSRLKVRKEVKQGERLDQEHRVKKWQDLNPRLSDAKAHPVSSPGRSLRSHADFAWEEHC